MREGADPKGALDAEFASCERPLARLRESGVRMAIVLGSGLDCVSERVEEQMTIPYAEIAGLPKPGVAGHRGAFLLGRLAGKPIVVARGRSHLYEGLGVREVTAGVRFLAAAGIKRLLLSNAAGSLNPGFEPGSWMLIEDHLNLSGHSPLRGEPSFLDQSEAWNPRLRTRLREAAVRADQRVHEGVYAMVPGPEYETPAEVRMLRTLGADAVGMSTVIECLQARALGLHVAGLTCLSNWAAGLSPVGPNHEEVLEAGRQAGRGLVTWLETALAEGLDEGQPT